MLIKKARSIHFIAIPVDNLENARTTFENKLGIKFEKEQHGNGPEHYATMIGGIVLELYPKNAGTKTVLGIKGNSFSKLIIDDLIAIHSS